MRINNKLLFERIKQEPVNAIVSFKKNGRQYMLLGITDDCLDPFFLFFRGSMLIVESLNNLNMKNNRRETFYMFRFQWQRLFVHSVHKVELKAKLKGGSL